MTTRRLWCYQLYIAIVDALEIETVSWTGSFSVVIQIFSTYSFTKKSAIVLNFFASLKICQLRVGIMEEFLRKQFF